MILSGIVFLLIIVLLFLFIKKNKFVNVIVMYFFSVSMIMLMGILYITRFNPYYFPFSIDYELYQFLFDIKLPLSKISRLYNFSFGIYMFSAVLFYKTLRKAKWWKTVLLSVPILFFLMVNDPYTTKAIWLISHSVNAGKAQFITLLSQRFKTVCVYILYAYMIVPVILLSLYSRKTAIFVKRKDTIVYGNCIMVINIFVYCFFIKGIYRSIMFNNIGVGGVPAYGITHNRYLFFPIILGVMTIIVISLVLYYKPFNIFSPIRHSAFRENSAFNKNLSMALHVYKNAFLGVGQQFELASRNIKNNDAEKALKNTERGRNIVNEYLALMNKMLHSIGDENIKLCEVDLIKCVEKAMENSVIPDEISVEFYAEDFNIIIKGNYGRLVEAFVNLFINAKEALLESENPTPKISVSIIRDDELVMLEIKDNGIGISKENKKKIFQPFFSTKSGNNSGVGLSYVLNVIRQHNGEIRVIGTPGVYTAFQVVLPIYIEGSKSSWKKK